MTQFLVLREYIYNWYQRHSFLLRPFIKFVIWCVVSFMINYSVGFNPNLKHLYINFGCGFLGVFMPTDVMIFLMGILYVSHIFVASKILTIVVGMFFLIIFMSYMQFAPKHGFVMFAIPLAFVLKVPYAVPIILGLFFEPIVIIPGVFGLIIYFTTNTLGSVISAATEDSVSQYQTLFQNIVSDKEMLVAIGIFVFITLLCYVIRRTGINYCYEIAMGAGILINAIAYLLTHYLLDMKMNMFEFLLGSILSMIFVFVAQFAQLALNYNSVERLQYEDEEYVYYVKAVPKMSIAEREKSVKRFNAHLFRDRVSYLNRDSSKSVLDELVSDDEGTEK